MGQEIKQLFESNVWLRVLTIVAIVLIVAGFILPPLAHIDGSVLTACGELAGFGALWLVYFGIEKGVGVTARHNNTEITVNNSNEEKTEGTYGGRFDFPYRNNNRNETPPTINL